jgi:FkbM family methyltransferase
MSTPQWLAAGASRSAEEACVKLLVISHSSVTPSNQDFYARVQRRLGSELTLVVPSRWRNEYGDQVAARWPRFEGRLVALPVLLRGNIPLHVYRARLVRLLCDERPDIVYVHHEPYGLATFQAFWAAHRTGTPAGFYSAQNLVKRYPPPVVWGERWVYTNATFAMAVSSEVAQTLQAKGYTGRIEVMPLGVDLSMYRRSERSRDRAQERAPLIAAYVGRLSDEKGLHTLIDALAYSDATLVRLLVAGDGAAREALHAHAAARGVDKRITWLGYVPHDEVAQVYAQTDVVIVPSKTTSRWKEQFGRVVVEALACGVPVAVSDSGELPRLVQQTGGGWVFPERDARSLARLLEAIAGDPAARTDRARIGAARVRALFDAELLAERFATTVSECARRPSRNVDRVTLDRGLARGMPPPHARRPASSRLAWGLASMVISRVPPVAGQVRLARRARRLLDDERRYTGLARCRTRDGALLALDTGDPLQADTLITRRWDPQLVSFVVERLPHRGVFFDVGAHVGLAALSVAARASGKCVRVHAFEPSSVNVALLRHNVGHNPALKVRVEHAAVGNAEGSVELVLGDESTHHHVAGDGTARGRESVRMLTLDGYARQHGIEHIDVLKVDVEGGEVEVLRGARRLFSHGRIGTVVCEVVEPHLSRAGTSVHELVAVMSAHGYDALPLLSRSQRVRDLLRGPSAVGTLHGDVAFVRRG